MRRDTGPAELPEATHYRILARSPARRGRRDLVPLVALAGVVLFSVLAWIAAVWVAIQFVA